MKYAFQFQQTFLFLPKRSFLVVHKAMATLFVCLGTQVIMDYALCRSIADVHNCCHLCWHDSSVYHNEGICVCWWSTSLDFIHYTCSSCFKVFYSFIHLSMIHNVYSILCLHLVMDFCMFAHYDTLFLNVTIADLIAHTFDFVASCAWLATHHPMQPCDVTCQWLPLTCI